MKNLEIKDPVLQDHIDKISEFFVSPDGVGVPVKVKFMDGSEATGG